MAHFAIINQENIVESVVVVSNERLLVSGAESEQAGIDYLQPKFSDKKIIQTSYNKKFRKNYAGIGYLYDESMDAFIPPKPFPSWILNENCKWNPPAPYPKDGKKYIWFEDLRKWTEQ